MVRKGNELITTHTRGDPAGPAADAIGIDELEKSLAGMNDPITLFEPV